MYCPTGFVDGEDGGKNVVQGSWRSEESPAFNNVLRVSSNRYVK